MEVSTPPSSRTGPQISNVPRNPGGKYNRSPYHCMNPRYEKNSTTFLPLFADE